MKLRDQDTENKIITAAKKKKLTVSQLRLESAANVSRDEELKIKLTTEQKNLKLFVNETISRRTKEVLHHALKMRKEGKITSAWTFNNKVFCETKDNDKPKMMEKTVGLTFPNEQAGKQQQDATRVEEKSPANEGRSSKSLNHEEQE